MAKYRYRIEGGRYGGEVVIGEVTNEFAKKAQTLSEEEIIDFLTDMDCMDFEPADESEEHPDPEQLPLPKEDYNMWECDDIEHLNGAYADGGIAVYEVPSDKTDDWDYDKEVFTGDANYVYGREGGCFGNEEPDLVMEADEDNNYYVPVLAFHSCEKGTFGCWFLDTNEPFDRYKLGYGIVETNVAELIDRMYYNKEELETDYDYNDTSGKSYHVSVGWLNTKWHDGFHDYQTLTDETWEDFDDNVEYDKEQNGD
jgi:hypothetical protein